MAAMRPASLKCNADKTLFSVIELTFSFEDLLESDAANDDTCDSQPWGKITTQARVDEKADRGEAQK